MRWVGTEGQQFDTSVRFIGLWLKNVYKGSSINDVTVLGGGGQGFSENSTKA